MLLLHRTLLRLAGDVRLPVLAGAAVGWALFAARVGQAVLVGLVLAAVLRGDTDGLAGLLGVLAVVVAVRATLVWLRDVVSQVAAERVKQRMRARLFGRLVELGPGHLVRTRTGEVQAAVVDGVEALEAYYSRYLPQLVVALTGPVLLVAWIISRAPWVGIAVLLTVLAVPLLPRWWDRLLRERGKDHWAAYGALGADYLDAMQGMATLKSFDAAAARRESLRRRADHLVRSTMRQMGVSLIDTGLTALGSQLGVALAIGIGAVQVARGELDIATAMVVLVLAGECFRPFQELSTHWHAGFLGVSAADSIAALLVAPSPAPDRPGVVPLPGDAPGSIAFEGVTFRYPDRPEPAARDVTVRIEPGEKVALVGRSGAGKSTLVGLALRFVEPDTGRVLVGGHDVRDVTADSLRRRIAVVSQDTYLFHGTVAENLRLAKPDATDADLVAAARAAGADDFVRALPGGYAARVGERGLTLSGGQRQRLAIARALLKDAPILILDEATSAVDTEHEGDVLAALDRLTAGRTVLVIAHRLSTVRHADRILVLADGQLVEQGRHQELLAAGGAYARLVDAQTTGAPSAVAPDTLAPDAPSAAAVAEPVAAQEGR